MTAAAALELPPPFSVVPLREIGDAFAHAQQIAAASGAGTLVWTRRFDLAEFAVVLEPDMPLHLARRVLYPAMNALGDTLAALAPPQRGIAFEWPDAVRVDHALVGGVRLAWPDVTEDEVPDWLVFGAMIRTVVMQAGEAGLRPLLGGLDEQGFEELSPSAVIESWTRYFLREMDLWNETGFEGAAARWRERAMTSVTIDDTGGASGKSLADALRQPGWLDPDTGAPYI
jgi:biotin-(acetyl-CoA carboxylase) ligase